MSKRSTSDLQTSQSLIENVKRNDPASWSKLVDLYSPLIYFWCQQTGLPNQQMPDLYQDVFFAIARNIQNFERKENGTFRGWLRTICRNKVNDYFRKSRDDPAPVGGTEAHHRLEQVPSPLIHENEDDSSSNSTNNRSSLEIELQRALLVKALANIRPHFQEQTWKAFWMVTMDGREPNEVGTELAMRPGTVRVAKSRVLNRLRKELGD